MQLSLLGETKETLFDRQPPDPRSPLIVSYGGGTNSTALIIALVLKNIKPDAILFADTGGELPETYNYLKVFSDYLKSQDFPEITIVKHTPMTHRSSGEIYSNLEEKCLISGYLPSKAYGRSDCSLQWKIYPMDKWVKHTFKPEIKQDIKIRRMIGYHAGEIRRIQKHGILEDQIFRYEYPLIDWGINQINCEALIASQGLLVPPKSSCFFCPNRKPIEVLWLKQNHPELYERGCQIEKNAEIKSQKTSLGRNFRWQDVGKLTPIELEILSVETKICQCIN